MIRIGEFAKIFNVTIKTVRYYEKIGLLIPKEVDIYTGYRYFDEQNIIRMKEILILKDLGFSLEEIKSFNQESIKEKIKNYDLEIENILKKKSFLNNIYYGELKIKDMEKFIVDKDAIGKWKLIAVQDKDKNIDKDYSIDYLYLMENNPNYWVISWTKGIIYINSVPNKYTIKNDKMYVEIIDKYDDTYKKIATYEKIDNKEYTLEEIQHKDTIPTKLEKDEKLGSFYKVVDYINNIDSFNPNITNNNLPLQELIFTPNQEVIIKYKDNDNLKRGKYTKNYIINLCLPDTMSFYQLKNIHNEQYLIVEWKSGDYVYSGKIYGYYVLKKV